MIEDYKIITITHKSAAIKDIGQYVLPESNTLSLSSRLEALKKALDISELIYLPTCNRVLYFFSRPGRLSQTFLSQFTELLYPDMEVSKEVFICHEGEKAMEHLFEVAASVDSLVVGEREIIRQLRESYEKCRLDGLTGDNLRLAMDATVKTAKRVYAQTRIGEKQVSIVSLAVKKLLESRINITDRILVIGAGQTNTLVCKFLKKYGFSKVTIFNRSLDKATELSKMLGGRAFPLSDLDNYREGFDCMIVCTASTDPIINQGNYSKLLGSETDIKVIIDLAIPNNVSAGVVENNDVDYIEIDGLKALAQENLGFRTKEVSSAKEIIRTEIEEYKVLYQERQLERAFGNMPNAIKEVKSKAINEVFAKEMEILDDDARELMLKMMDYMEKKCISIPMKAAKKTFLP